MGLAIVAAILMSNSLSMVEIIEAQRKAGVWFVFPGLIAFFLYFLSGVAETNRTPFDLPEAESELVGGFHTEYSGFRWAVFFMSEYGNMISISAVATTLFFGGWLRPFPNVAWLSFLDVVPAFFWFAGKVFLFLIVYIWFRATFPRYRFDQLMSLGWKTLIPISLANLFFVALAALWGAAGLKVLGAVLVALVAVGLLAVWRRPARPRTSTTMASANVEVRA
jgi:NADH-quinone oxidoreductase subunit H